MAFGLSITSAEGKAFVRSIELELAKRGLSEGEDATMAEYIGIMVVNNKTSEQINTELEDLIGLDYDRTFTDWLFEEAAKSAAAESATATDEVESPARDPPPHHSSTDGSRRASAPRSGFQQAIAQVGPSTSSGQKRTASARSPSPSPGGQPPNKSRRTDAPPRGPRAMGGGSGGQNRSLIDRMGGPNQRFNGRQGHDDVQARIDNITRPGMPGPMDVDMAMFNGMGMGGAPNPMMLQEMMMNQMALMAQMANTMGMLGPNGAIPGGGFPGQNGMFDTMQMQNALQQQQQQQQGQGHMDGQFPGRGRGGRGRGRGGSRGGDQRQGQPTSPASVTVEAPVAPAPAVAQPIIAAPTPIPAAAAAVPSGPVLFNLPERPQSPTLCKFGLKCTNAHCRYSHPSPVATAESGVVLSTEACEAGKNCKDKDCVKGHVSPAIVNGSAVEHKPAFHPPPQHHLPSTSAHIPCRYGAGCTKQHTGTCPFSHPKVSTFTAAPPGASTTACRFGAGCTRASCQFQHPEGRVLPSTFHRGLSATGGMTNVHAPATGTMGAGGNQHRTVVFNTPKAGTNGKGDEKKEASEKAEVEAVVGATDAGKAVEISA